MKEIYLLGTDVYEGVLRLRWNRGTDPIFPSLHRQSVRYNITPSEVRVPGYFSRTALLVKDSAGVSAYLHRKNTLHRQYQADYEFCERLLLHLEGKRLDNLLWQEISQWSPMYPSGRVDVLAFQDIESADTLSAQNHDEALPSVSLDDKSPRRYRGSVSTKDNTSELPE